MDSVLTNILIVSGILFLLAFAVWHDDGGEEDDEWLF